MRIGVFGISGVGKSFLVERFADEREEFVSVKASHLIKQAERVTLLKDLTDKVVRDNQEVLINEFNSFCDKHHDKDVIIELHNIIETPEGVSEIDNNILYNLNLDAVCFLYLIPSKLNKQRLNDSSRVRPVSSAEALAELQSFSLKKFKITFNERSLIVDTIYEDHFINFCNFIEKVKKIKGGCEKYE